jgi:hypothetical protein
MVPAFTDIVDEPYLGRESDITQQKTGTIMRMPGFKSLLRLEPRIGADERLWRVRN